MPRQLHFAQHDPSSLAAVGFLSRYREPTVSAYRDDLRCFWTWCADHDLTPLQARRSHLELHLRDLQDKGYAAATVAGCGNEPVPVTASPPGRRWSRSSSRPTPDQVSRYGRGSATDWRETPNGCSIGCPNWVSCRQRGVQR